MTDEITYLCRMRNAVDTLLEFRILLPEQKEMLEDMNRAIEAELEIVVADNHTLSI